MKHVSWCSSYRRSESSCIPIACAQIWNFIISFAELLMNYLCKPSNFLITRLWYIPLIFRSVSNSLKLIIYLPSQLSLIVSIPQLFVIINSINRFSLIPHLHQQIWVIIRFLGIEMNVLRTIDLKLLIYLFMYVLLVKTLTVYTHLLI